VTGTPKNMLKAGLTSGEVHHGLWLASASPIIAELAGGAGFDWCLIDWEHGPNDLTSVVAQLQALQATGTPAVVRTPAAEDWMIKQALDAGAQTLLIPLIHSAADAKAAARAMRYPPDGHRGMGAALARSSDFARRTDYVSTIDAEVCCLVQAESVSAMKELDQICAVDGVDGVFIGPADLSADMGLPGQPRHPDVMAEIERGLNLIRAKGKIAGIVGFAADEIALYKEWGANFVGVGADTMVLMRGLKALKDQVT